MATIGIEIDLAKVVQDISKTIRKIRDAEVRKEVDVLLTNLTIRIREDQALLTELSRANMSLERRLHKVESEGQDLKAQDDLAQKLFRDDHNPWLALEGDRDGTARYCMLCWDKEKKLIRLYKDDNYEKVCRNCGQFFLFKGIHESEDHEAVFSDLKY